MAKELGMKPTSMQKLAPNRDQQWKSSIDEYIEHCYDKRKKKKKQKEKRKIKLAKKEEEEKRKKEENK